jgi:hypothetical protein
MIIELRPRRRHRRRRQVALTGVVAGLLTLVCAVAFAYWVASGTGSAAAMTGSTTAVTLTPGTPSAQLYPGGTADVVLTVANPNSSPVRIGSLALDPTQGTGGFKADTGHAGCVLSALSFTTQTNAGSGWTVPAGGSLPVTLSSSLAMATGAANGCQGATFTVYLKVAS